MRSRSIKYHLDSNQTILQTIMEFQVFGFVYSEALHAVDLLWEQFLFIFEQEEQEKQQSFFKNL